MKQVSLIVVGAGSRGTGYAKYAHEQPARAKVVGVAEPREFHRRQLAQSHAIPEANVLADWRELASRPRLADAAIIATQDDMHAEPAVMLAAKGYNILLEKPMAPNEADCRRIVSAVKKAGVMFAVCHVLRYTRYTQKLKSVIAAGLIGDVVSIQHLEPVGYWHQAHSFVRGNWRNEKLSSPMLLSKSCHDLDWIRYIMGVPCRRVSSFGALKHFRKECKPAGAADRCLDCSVEPRCPYSAKKLYMGCLRNGNLGWPADVLTTDTTEAGLLEALRSGPFGRCVYECDNDVVDNQVVAMDFDGRRTGCFTMTAFTKMAARKTRIFGTLGELEGVEDKLTHFDFLSDETRPIEIDAGDPTSALSAHGGGDFGVMHGFVSAVMENDPRHILTGPDETLETHLMVFRSEQARREGRVVELS